MTPRQRDDPDTQLGNLRDEIGGLNARLGELRKTAAEAQNELLRDLPQRLTAARAAAARGRPDALGVLGARELELQQLVSDCAAQVAGVEAALVEVGREVREHYAANVDHYASLARQASEAALVASDDLSEAISRLDAARAQAHAAWDVVPGAGDWPHIGDLSAVRFHLRQAVETAPYPKGVERRGVDEDEPAAA